MANFYLDNPDLRRRIGQAAWDEILPALEDDFRDADGLAPSGVEEAVEQIGMVLETVGQIAADEIAPFAAEVDREGARLVDGEVVYPAAIRRAFGLLAEAGLVGLTLPRAYGGMNFPVTAYTAVVEMISRADAAFMTLFALQGCGDTIHRFGGPGLHERFLPGLCAGKTTACMALTEPHAGSALDTVTTRARQAEDGTWRIRGSKCFITNGGADVLLVLARSEEAVMGAYGLSLFVVEKGPAVRVTKLEDKLGIHGSATAALDLEDAPAELLGGRGGGLLPAALSLMNNARLEVAAQAVGIAQAAQVQAVRYAGERKQGRRTIDSFPAVRALLFENAVHIEAARAITVRTASVLDRLHGVKRAGGSEQEADRLSQLADLLTPLAKYYASEMANGVASRALQVHGGYGYMRDYPAERHLRDARITSIYEGTSEIQASTMIRPLLQGGLALLFEERLAAAAEPAHCAGVLDMLRAAYGALERSMEGVRAAGKLGWQGWARHFAEATADLLAGLVFLEDAAADERSGYLARHKARAAFRSARSVAETVEARDFVPFEDESFGSVVSSYRG